jgi:hypothetical protein
MSRDAFSRDPQDTRDATPPRSPRQRPRTLVDAPHSADHGPELRGRSEAAKPRAQNSGGDERSDFLRAYYVRDRAYLLRDSEIQSLAAIGKFHVIAAPDLAKFEYNGDRDRMEKDVRHLRKQGLLAGKTIEVSRRKSLRVVTLTKAGHRLLKKANQVPDDQVIYHGLRKPREVEHDADLYRLYHKEAARIERAGGRPLRVILDYELKRQLNRDLALLGPDQDNDARRSEVAEKHGLQLVHGKIPVPDLRIEYETVELEIRHQDLELATRQYRPNAISAKAAAGFSLYSRPEDASRLRRILDERKITAGILTL